jgi:tetratricopeptide (TPR) repeat protein
LKLALALAFLAAGLQGATARAPLDAEPASARVAALGGAALGLSGGDGWELDPSSLALGPAWRVSADQALLALDLQRQGLQGQWSAGPGAAWGLRLSHLSFGSLERRDASGALQGAFEPRRLSAGLGFGWVAAAGFSLGSSLSFYHQDLGGLGVSAGQVGLAARWAYAHAQHLGAALQATSHGLERLALGGGGRLPAGLSYSLQGLGEAQGQAWSLQAGLERAFGAADLRGGWRQDLMQAGDALSGLSVGGGLQWRGWALDYAWQSLGLLGAAHRLSLSLQPWSAPAEAPQEPALREDEAPALPMTEPLPEAQPTPAPAPPGPALQLEFRLPDSPLDQAYQAEEDGDVAAARARYEEALKLDPKDTRAWMGLGHLHYRRGDLDTAVQCFEQVLRLNPTEVKLKDWLEALKDRRRAP